jgi:hypothetical protein
MQRWRAQETESNRTEFYVVGIAKRTRGKGLVLHIKALFFVAPNERGFRLDHDSSEIAGLCCLGEHHHSRPATSRYSVSR